MNALIHDFDLTAEQELPTPRASLADRWDALHDAGAAIAGFAQLSPERPERQKRDLPRIAAAGPKWRIEAIERGVDDLSAVMQTGLRALIFAAENGCDTTAGAVTLWREYHAGREAVCSLLAPTEDAG